MVANYFSGRSQITKIGKNTSGVKEIKLGVPQGSILGPLFFLIFINDLPFFVNDLRCKLFADDTTLYHQHDKLDHLIYDFSKKVTPLFEWCKRNRIDINWEKTYFMFVTNRRVVLPEYIKLNGITIDTVKSFKLLGVIIDNKLAFNEHVSNLCQTINSKLFSIKRVFSFCTSVKIQFFKTFILPYFDYCISLFIYFNKQSLQKLCNKYYLCLFKLFNIEFSSFSSIDEINNFLHRKFNIFSFQHRIFKRISIFSFKLINFSNSPEELLDTILKNNPEQKAVLTSSSVNYKLLRNNKIVSNTLYTESKYIHSTFDYFSKVLIEAIGIERFLFTLSEFKIFLNLNLNNLFSYFNTKFCKFNLTCKQFNWSSSNDLKT